MSLSVARRRVPLLWLLLPLSFGIALSPMLDVAPLLIAGAGLLSAAAAVAYSKNESTLGWAISICAAAAAIGYLRGDISAPAQSSNPLIVPREAFLDLRLQTLFNSQAVDRYSGLALVEHASLHLEDQVGTLLYFSLHRSESERPPVVGETYAAKGVLRPLELDSEHSGGFQRYLYQRGVQHRYVQGDLLERKAPASRLRYTMQRSSEEIARVLGNNRRPDSEYTGAYKAMMLGKKNELSPEQRDLFLRNGAMHLFAISGLHIGIIAACAHHLLVFLRIGRSLRPPLSLLIVLCFVLSTGGSASSWRALLMVACFYLCQGIYRQVGSLNALALAASVYLVIAPLQLFQAGFQMSYLTVASILLTGVPLARRLDEATPIFGDLPPSAQGKAQRAILWLKRAFFGALAISASAYASSSLLGLYYFEILPTYGIFANLIALPIASLAIVAGFLALLCAPLPFIPLSEIFNNAAITAIAATQWILERFLELPGASLNVTQPRSDAILISLGAVFALAAIAYSRGEKRFALAWELSPLAATIVALFALANSH